MHNENICIFSMIKKELKSQVACRVRTAQQLEQGVQTNAG